MRDECLASEECIFCLGGKVGGHMPGTYSKTSDNVKAGVQLFVFWVGVTPQTCAVNRGLGAVRGRGWVLDVHPCRTQPRIAKCAEQDTLSLLHKSLNCV